MENVDDEKLCHIKFVQKVCKIYIRYLLYGICFMIIQCHGDKIYSIDEVIERWEKNGRHDCGSPEGYVQAEAVPQG